KGETVWTGFRLLRRRLSMRACALLLRWKTALLPLAARYRLADPKREGHHFRRARVDLAAIAQFLPLAVGAKGYAGSVDYRALPQLLGRQHVREIRGRGVKQLLAQFGHAKRGGSHATRQVSHRGRSQR